MNWSHLLCKPFGTCKGVLKERWLLLLQITFVIDEQFGLGFICSCNIILPCYPCMARQGHMPTSFNLRTRSRLVRGTPTVGVLLHWVIISRRWERIQKRDSEWPINTDSPRKKSAAIQWPHREIKGPKNTQNWHHFTWTSSSTHPIITYVYSHYCIWSFCHHFPCKNDVLITSTRIEFSNHENKQSLTQTFYLLLYSCRIVNVRYRNDLLVTEIRVAKFGS